MSQRLEGDSTTQKDQHLIFLYIDSRSKEKWGQWLSYGEINSRMV